MFTLPDLPYSFDALEPFIDRQTMELHHDKHHAAYVKNLNDLLMGHADLLEMDIEELVKNLDKIPQDLKTKIRNNAGQHYNHSFFWTVMTPLPSLDPKGELLEKINNSFESLKNFKDQFSKSAIGLFGSGWVWLVTEGNNLVIKTTPNGDSPLMDKTVPILGLDVWEHAYYLQYQNRRLEYVQAWWNIVNWDEVNRRFQEVI